MQSIDQQTKSRQIKLNQTRAARHNQKQLSRRVDKKPTTEISTRSGTMKKDDDKQKPGHAPTQSTANTRQVDHKKHYKTDRIITHTGRGAQTKYLVQYREINNNANVKRAWMKSNDIANRPLVEYRGHLKKEANNRRLSRLLDKLMIPRKRPRTGEAFAQVDTINKKPRWQPNSILARKPLRYDMSTQTDLSYFS